MGYGDQNKRITIYCTSVFDQSLSSDQIGLNPFKEHYKPKAYSYVHIKRVLMSLCKTNVTYDGYDIKCNFELSSVVIVIKLLLLTLVFNYLWIDSV